MSKDNLEKVCNTLNNGKYMVDIREDGIYIRLAGNEDSGYAFSEEFVKVYPLKSSHTQPSVAYDKNFGDNRLCECRHPYYRHFDSYDNMAAVGCKYCQCDGFKEAQPKPSNPEKDWQVECFTEGKYNYWRQRNGLYTNQPFDKGINEEHFLDHPEVYKIWQVKRLSDGEVFSVGDEVEFRSVDDRNWEWPWGGKIISITKCRSGKPELEFEIYEDDSMESAVHKWIRNIRHKSSPIEREVKKNMFEAMNELVSQYQHLKYTQQQLEDARRDAFNAARGLISEFYKTNPCLHKFPTFEDYKSKLPNQ